MSEFCENCPIKGRLSGEIAAQATGYVDFERKQAMGYGPLIASYHGDVGVFLDEFGNTSEPVFFPPNRTPDQMIGMVANCDGPVIETKGIIRKRNYVAACSALGRFACHEPVLNKYVKGQLR